MKLLICTQAVDQNHPILGFFHRWIEEFAKHCEEVHVICLQKGEYSLPHNVHVYSLGKEGGERKFVQFLNFYKYIWKLRKNYDNVFVHMTQIYVLLGALVWRLQRKKIGFWYAHGAVSVTLRLAEKLTHFIFTSTEQGLQLHTAKKNIVGQGIDLAHFAYRKKSDNHKTLRLITVGRISVAKSIDTLIAASKLLYEAGFDFTITIAGTASTGQEKEYEKAMRTQSAAFGLSDHILWAGDIMQKELPQLLYAADVFIHDGVTQSLDKALLEAVACGCTVISSNPSYAAFSKSYAPQYIFPSRDVNALYSIIKSVSELSGEERDASMKGVREALRMFHSIEGLISRIIKKYE